MHAERLADIALTPPEVTAGSHAAKLDQTSVEITVRNVSFRYSEQDPWILRGVSFTIKPEQSVAIVGPSGCGKTTLLKILAGLLQPSEGEVLLNGVEIRRIGLARFRQMIGVVMQDDSLFAGSVAENISFFVDNPDQQLVEDCAMLAAVHDDIAAMPMGYGTLIGDMCTVLSGGQKQRILIARALYRLPFLLLLDEATSHLDVEREKMVNNALRESQITRIVIAHRPETINASDRVIRLERGQMVEQVVEGSGSH